MNTWLARVRFGVAYPDWAGLLAVGLALVALVLHGVILPAQEDRLAELEQQVAGVEKSARRLRMRTDAVATTQASAGEGRFVAPERLADRLRQLQALLDEAELAVDSIDYRRSGSKDALIERYVVTLPLEASYRVVRGFLARVREQLPGCAIEEVSLQRQRIEDDTLTAQVRLVFFVRRGDAS